MIPLAGPIPWLTLIGIGEDGREGLSPGAWRAIAAAKLVVGGRRHLRLLGPVAAETLAWRSPIEVTIPDILARRPAPVCVLASGDPFCFGVGSLLARHLPAFEMACLPQPSSFSLAAARLGWALQDCALLSFCGRPIETLIPALHPGAKILALSADASTPSAVAALLSQHGFGQTRLTVCEALGGPRERLRSTTAAAFDLGAIDALNLLAITVEASPEAELPQLVAGRPDFAFEHDGQITKSDIRAITLAKLAPRRGACLWDVGAGSGAVGIEWMLADPANRAIAIERHGERAARIRRNALRFGVPGLRILESVAPQAYAGLPPPDAVFVGGGATAPGVVAEALAQLRPAGRCVINAVTIETQSLLIDLYKRHGGQLSSLTFAEAAPVGGFHGWKGAMPVTQWHWVRP